MFTKMEKQQLQRYKYESTISEIESKYSGSNEYLKSKSNEFRFLSRELKKSTNPTPLSDLCTQVSDLKPFHNDYQRYTYSQSQLKKLNQDIVNSSSTPRDQEESPT